MQADQRRQRWVTVLTASPTAYFARLMCRGDSLTNFVGAFARERFSSTVCEVAMGGHADVGKVARMAGEAVATETVMEAARRSVGREIWMYAAAMHRSEVMAIPIVMPPIVTVRITAPAAKSETIIAV